MYVHMPTYVCTYIYEFFIVPVHLYLVDLGVNAMMVFLWKATTFPILYRGSISQLIIFTVTGIVEITSPHRQELIHFLVF
jgi:hypothetical protein